MNIREDVIYARQSVDRKDSISIESQIDFCKYELKGGSCRVFKDKGYSGKNTDRPEFQKLLPLYQPTCFFIPLVAPCKPLLVPLSSPSAIMIHLIR